MALLQEGHIEQVLHIFGYLKIHKKMGLIFDCIYTRIDSKLFKEYEWFDFYTYTKEAITPNIPESRGEKISIYMFFDTELTLPDWVDCCVAYTLL